MAPSASGAKVTMNSRVRAPLPARLALAENVHCSIDAETRMSRLLESDVLEIEGLTRLEEFCQGLVERKQKNKTRHFPSSGTTSNPG